MAASTIFLAPVTIGFHQAQQLVSQQRQNQRQQRYAAFQEFKSSFHDLFDVHDWEHYAQATGLKLATLLKFRREYPQGPERLFARAPSMSYFEPLSARTGQWTDTDYQATLATPGLLAYLAKQNPGWEFRAAFNSNEANRR